MDRLLKLLEVPNRVLLWLSLLAGFLMMLHVSVDVAARAFFNRPLAGTNEIVSAWYMVATAFLPWAYIAASDGHIRVELFTRAAPARFNEWLDILVKLLMAAYVAVFTWQTALRAIEQVRAGEAWELAGGYLPVWPSRCLLPVAGAFMILTLLARVLADIARAARR
jgi:TRAP-type C4-dicarboxylate transport system permease small subunit